MRRATPGSPFPAVLSGIPTWLLTAALVGGPTGCVEAESADARVEDSIHDWTQNGPGVAGAVFVPVVANPWRLYRVPLNPAGAAATGLPVTAQLVTFLSTPVGSGGGCSSLFSASPALWFMYQ